MRRRWYGDEVDGAPALPDRPVSLVKDEATKLFAHWTTNWADAGWRRPFPPWSPDGEGPAAPSGPDFDDTPGEQAVAFGDAVAVPVAGAYLISEGVVRPLASSWVEMGPTRDGRTRWGITTKYEGDEHD